MFGSLFAPRLKLKDAIILSRQLARIVVEQGLDSKSFIMNAEELLTFLFENRCHWLKNHKVTPEESRQILKQATYYLEKYRDSIEKDVGFSNSSNNLSDSDFFDQHEKLDSSYIDKMETDTPYLQSFNN